jgi:uncharacterized membrane protein
VETRSQGIGAHSASLRVVSMLAIGALAAVATGLILAWDYALVVGWIVAALAYTAWVWLRIGRMSPEETRTHATREDPSRGIADALLVVASLASLAIVALVLVRAAAAGPVESGILAVLAIASTALSWALIHTLFTLRYASLYYADAAGGVDFNQDEEPGYGDFAYLAFTLGMTYQVSDTALRTRAFRMTALRHGLLSYLFGAVILATMINLVAGLGG